MSKMFTLISRSRTCTLETHTRFQKDRPEWGHQTLHLNLLGDAVVDPDSGQILGDKPFLTVAFNDAALGNKTMEQRIKFIMDHDCYYCLQDVTMEPTAAHFVKSKLNTI